MRRVAAAATMVLLLTACAPDVTPPPLPTPAASPPLPPPPPGHNDFAAARFARPLSVSDAEQILRRTTIFAYGGMNHLPHSEAVAVIARETDALAIARRLAREAGPAGKLLALCLFKIHESSDDRASPERAEVERLADDLSTISTPILFWESDVTDEVAVRVALLRVMNRRLWVDVLDDGRRRLRPERSK